MDVSFPQARAWLLATALIMTGPAIAQDTAAPAAADQPAQDDSTAVLQSILSSDAVAPTPEPATPIVAAPAPINLAASTI